MSLEKGSIKKYIIIIMAILGAAFLSQQVFFREAGQNLISGADSQIGAYLAKGSGWAISDIVSKISGEAQKRGDAIKTDVNQEKNKISENILTKVENYFSGIADSIFHPGENNNCQTQPSQNPSNP